MGQVQARLNVSTRGPGLYECTHDISRWLAEQASHQSLQDGLLTLFIQHTSASLTIQENADPAVLDDLQAAFARLAPVTGPYTHSAEGPDDMPAHIKAALTQTSLSIPVSAGRLTLGTWQGIYVFEHRDRPHQRTILLHLLTD